MKILLITPAAPGSRQGNRITALRWARILRALGHASTIAQDFRGQSCDMLVALHARRSFAAVERFRQEHPQRPLILALTGTDLYGDIHTDAQAQQALELASLFVLLQPHGINQLPRRLQPKARVIFQSVQSPPGIYRPKKNAFELCVLGHLRPVKDPFRTAAAVRDLPADSQIQVVHLGGALSPDMAQQARQEQAQNPRYQWLGEWPRWKALRRLARCRLLVLTSLMEGGANAVSEALACCVPVVSSRISGSLGMLGEDYPGYFSPGDTPALTTLLHRAEQDPAFYRQLRDQCNAARFIVDPANERLSWQNLLAEL